MAVVDEFGNISLGTLNELSIITELGKKITATRVEPAPYPHFVLENLLHDSDLKFIREEWPHRSFFTPDIESTYTCEPQRYGKEMPQWLNFMATKGVEIATAVAQKFSPWIDARYGRDSEIVVRWGGCMESDSSYKGHMCHTHHYHDPLWVGTILFYIDTDAVGYPGTSIFGSTFKPRNLKKEASLASDTLLWFNSPEITEVREVEYKPNRALAFFDSPISYHGVHPSGETSGMRRVLRFHLGMDYDFYMKKYGCDQDEYRKIRWEGKKYQDIETVQNWLVRDIKELWSLESVSEKTYVRANKKREEQNPEKLRILFSLVLWGDNYIENFLDLCLPSMLAEGNFANLPNNRISKFEIRTTPEDKNRLLKNRAFQYLQQNITVEFVDLDPSISGDKYFLLSQSQYKSVQTARSKNTIWSEDEYVFHYDAIFFLYADFVWAKGSFRSALKRLAEGYEGVVTPVPPLVLESFQDLIVSEKRRRNISLSERGKEEKESPSTKFELISDREFGYIIDVSPRELIHLGKPILHPMLRDNIIDYERNSGNPAYVLWLGPNDDLLIRCFHAHPVAVRVQKENPRFWEYFDRTLDEVFLPQIFTSLDRVHYVEDSDELAMVSLTEAALPVSSLPKGQRFLDSAYIARWAEAVAAPLHKYMFNRHTLWHSEDIKNEEWSSTFERSTLTADEVRFKLTLPDSLSAEDPHYFAAREERREKFQEITEISDVIEKCENHEGSESEKIEDLGRSVTVSFNRFLFKVMRVIAKPFGVETRKRLRAILPKRFNKWVEFSRRHHTRNHF